jgi:histidyl-tRNA synthetase
MNRHTQPAPRPHFPELVYVGPYKKAISICESYGVTLIKPPQLTKDTEEYTEKFGEKDGGGFFRTPTFAVNERASIIRAYSDGGWETLPQPVLVMYTKKEEVRRERLLHIHVIGISKPIADMLVMHLAWTILSESVKTDLMMHVNSIGDKDSSARFVTELTAYYRKRINFLPDESRELFKMDILNILKKPLAESIAFREEAPKSVSFLSERSRAHFKEIIEFIEGQNIPYVIDHSLVDSKDVYSETLFSIRSRSNELYGEVYAAGARSDNLTRGLGMRKTVPIVSATISIPGAMARENTKLARAPRKKKHLVYFIQLGYEARLKSFKLLEKLRKAKLPFAFSIGKEKMSSQIAQAEKLKTPIVLVMGQKEAVEDNVIVRNMETNSQETVGVDAVVDYIKTLLP